MNVLGIETSSIVCSVGYTDRRAVSVERSLVDPHIHSEKLLTLVKEVIEKSETDLRSLDAVAVSIGPGSFTGLRIGLSTAKGLCYSLGVKLLTVPTFDAIAQAARSGDPNSTLIHIAVDARQGEFYYGYSEKRGSEEVETISVQTQRLETLPWTHLCRESSLWITDRPEVIRDYGIPSLLIKEFTSFCRGDVVAHVGIDKCHRNEFADLASVEPLYLKEFLVKNAKS